jgi:hypothetical protein
MEHDAFDMLSDKQRHLLSDTIRFLLDQQFVVSSELANRIFHVQRGTGQGLKHSGDLADICLAHVAEINWASNKRVQAAFGIKLFTRFRDDTFIIATDRTLSHKYLRGYIERGRFFKIICEGINREKMKFLDMTVIHQGNYFKVIPSLKESFFNNHPLCPSSCHVPHVHKSWPVAQIKRLGRLSTLDSDALQTKEIYISKFTDHFASDDIIQLLRSTSVSRGGHGPREPKRPPTIWLVLGYHPVLYNFINKTVAKINLDCALREISRRAWGDGFANDDNVFNLRVGWKNKLQYWLKRVQRRSDGDGG